MNNTWDVYIWPINDASFVKCVASNVSFEKATAIYNKYMDGSMYDAYMVPAGTKLFI